MVHVPCSSRYAIARRTIALLAVSACAPAPPPAEHPHASRTTEQSNLLLSPVADAEGLLGRAVQVTADGGWTTAAK